MAKSYDASHVHSDDDAVLELFLQQFRAGSQSTLPISSAHMVLDADNTGDRAAEYANAMVQGIYGSEVPGVDLASVERIAVGAACAAVGVIRQRRGELTQDTRGIRVAAASVKSSSVDPVTLVDREVEAMLRHHLTRDLPNSTVLGEEFGVDDQQAGHSAGQHVQWVIDPIDGTVNFMYGVPAFAVSIAATIAGVPVVAVVADVAAGEVVAATLGSRPRIWKLNGDIVVLPSSEIAAQRPVDLEQSLIATGFGYQSARRQRQAELLCSVLPKVRDIRRAGAAALDLVGVATGTLDAYYEHGLGPWDYAAGALIAARAGAIVQMPNLRADSSEGLLVTACSPAVEDALLAVLDGRGAGGRIG